VGKLLTVGNIHRHVLFFLIKERIVPGVFLTRFCPQFSFIYLLQNSISLLLMLIPRLIRVRIRWQVLMLNNYYHPPSYAISENRRK